MSNIDKKAICETCCFWTLVDGQKGICQRFPPAPFGERYSLALFPLTMPVWWCGEHSYGHWSGRPLSEVSGHTGNKS